MRFAYGWALYVDTVSVVGQFRNCLLPLVGRGALPKLFK